MGAWGSEPDENDGAGDLFYPIEDTWNKHGVENAIFNLNELISGKVPDYLSKTQYQWELLGVIQMFLRRLEKPENSKEKIIFLNDELIPHILWTAHQFCQNCLNDTVWHKEWRDVKQVKFALQLFKKKLLGIIPNCCD